MLLGGGAGPQLLQRFVTELQAAFNAAFQVRAGLDDDRPALAKAALDGDLEGVQRLPPLPTGPPARPTRTANNPPALSSRAARHCRRGS